MSTVPSKWFPLHTNSLHVNWNDNVKITKFGIIIQVVNSIIDNKIKLNKFIKHILIRSFNKEFITDVIINDETYSITFKERDVYKKLFDHVIISIDQYYKTNDKNDDYNAKHVMKNIVTHLMQMRYLEYVAPKDEEEEEEEDE